MKGKRRRHEPEFKARVALEAIKGVKTIQQIAKEYDVHPVQVSEWKKTMLAGAALAFSGEKPAGLGEEQLERERTRLHSKIGELSIQVDFLKKKCRQLGLPED
jgi:transposase-like protein